LTMVTGARSKVLVSQIFVTQIVLARVFAAKKLDSGTAQKVYSNSKDESLITHLISSLSQRNGI